MFVRYFTVLESPAEAIRAALTNGGPEWMSSVALQSDDRRGELVSRVGVPLSEHHSLSKVVRVSLGTSTRLGETTVLPMSWEATGPLGLFPVMDGDLEIAPLGEERTMLAMSARYRPPLGAVGRIADRALLHRVAEATIKDFVDRVADRLMDASVRSDGSSREQRNGQGGDFDPDSRVANDG
jgi:hypothetical protein